MINSFPVGPAQPSSPSSPPKIIINNKHSTFPRLFVFNRTTLSIVNKKTFITLRGLTELRFSLKIFVNFHKNKEVILP